MTQICGCQLEYVQEGTCFLDSFRTVRGQESEGSLIIDTWQRFTISEAQPQQVTIPHLWRESSDAMCRPTQPYGSRVSGCKAGLWNTLPPVTRPDYTRKRSQALTSSGTRETKASKITAMIRKGEIPLILLIFWFVSSPPPSIHLLEREREEGRRKERERSCPTYPRTHWCTQTCAPRQKEGEKDAL